jgi:hypothetical protein
VAGFLDKNTRVVDMVLTGEGKYLLSKGELRFVYWMPFDVEIDYDPYIANSGSLTGIQLSASINEQIENSPIREATTGYRRLNMSGSDETNVRQPLFSVPQGHRVIPRMTASDGPSGDINIEVKQRKISELVVKRDPSGVVLEQLGPYDRGFERFDTSAVVIDQGYSRDGFPVDHVLDGFLVKVYRSGSNGLVEVDARRDLSNELAFGNDLRLVVDQDELSDGDE